MRVCSILHRAELLFCFKKKPRQEAVFSLCPRTELEVLCLCLFFSLSLTLPCFHQLVTSLVSKPFLHHARPLPFTAFTVAAEAIQLWKCYETSDSTSCSNRYISGPLDAHPQLRMNRHTCTFSQPHTPGVISHCMYVRVAFIQNN